MGRSPITIAVVIIALFFVTAAVAQAAINVPVPVSRADDDTRLGYVVSNPDFTVSNIVYTYDIADPSYIAAVEFDLNGVATSVEVSFAANGTLGGCVNTGGFSWSCDVTRLAAVGTNSLHVMVNQ